MMGRKRLSSHELTQAIEKIRKGYDDYRVRYITSGRERRRFEERYIEALRSRADMAAFVAAEMEFLHTLMEQGEEQQRRETSRSDERQRAGDSSNAAADHADRVIAALKEQVAKYPTVGLGHEDLWELDHLYGALFVLEREYWPPVERIYRRVYPSRFSGPRLLLESRLYELTETRGDEFPVRLNAIRDLLQRFPRTLVQIEREAKNCILQAAFFLHDLAFELRNFRNDSYLREEEKKTVENALLFVHTVIEDFRLQDLKEKRKTARS